MTEHHMARRYDLSLPVNIRLPINLEPKSDSGQTRDISTRGVYFTAHKDLAPGTELDFTLTLPAEITRGSKSFRACAWTCRTRGQTLRRQSRNDWRSGRD